MCFLEGTECGLEKPEFKGLQGQVRSKKDPDDRKDVNCLGVLPATDPIHSI